MLKDVTFTAAPGTTVALVGHTGAGKTTIVNLLLRFYDVERGRITIDGVDIRELSFTELRGLIGFVQQDLFLFTGDILHTMTANDSAGALAVMRADGQYYAVRSAQDTTVVRRMPHAQYFGMLATGKSRFVERIWEPTVLVHGPIAVVWAAYDFHVDGKFSHCGVDAFSLVRESGTWKIAGITYTTEPTGCAPSPLGALPGS